MRVKIQRNCSVAGSFLSKGRTYDLPDRQAKDLVKMGRAVVAPARKPRKKPAKETT